MTTGWLTVGERVLLDGDLLCVAWIDPVRRFAYLSHENGRCWPQPHLVYRVEGRASSVASPNPVVRAGSAAEAEMGRRFSLVGKVLGDPVLLQKVILAEGRAEALRAFAATHNQNLGQTVRYLKLYWARGSIPTGLYPSFICRGGVGKSRDGRAGLGRPSRTGERAPAMTEELFSRLREGLIWGTRDLRTKTYSEILRHVWNKYYAICDADGTVVAFSGALPTLGQLRRVKERCFTTDEWRRRRLGERKYLLKGRALLGFADQHVIGPGDQFQIDATIADIYLVSTIDRATIVGRPTIYFIVDLFSRMIVSIYITFDPPSWVAAMVAMVNLVTSKVEYCQRYGVTIAEDDWPCHHLPSALLGDKGEMERTAAGNALTRNLGISLLNAASRRADMKAVCERKFRTIQGDFRPYVPGAVQKDANERGAPDYKRQASLTLDEFTSLIIRSVLIHNNAKSVAGYLCPPAMILQGLAPSPLNLWKWGIANRSGILRKVSPSVVSLAVLPEGEAKLDSHGLSFLGNRYQYPSADGLGWAADAREGGVKSVPVRYDPRDLSTLVIVDPRLERPEIAIMRNPERMLGGHQAFAEIELLRQKAKFNRDQFEAANRLNLLNHQNANNALSLTSRENSRPSPGHKQRKARSVERKLLQDTEYFPSSFNKASVVTTTQPDRESDNSSELNLLRELRQKRRDQ